MSFSGLIEGEVRNRVGATLSKKFPRKDWDFFRRGKSREVEVFVV